MRNAPGPPTTLTRYQSSIPGSSPEAIGRPFTVSPCDTATSRASAVATSPVFCRPSPDPSMICRKPTRGCSAKQVLGGDDAAAGISHRMHPGPARAAQAGCQGLEFSPPAKDGPRHSNPLLLCPFDDGNLNLLI